jgi:site-specific recombinase XerD
LSRLRHTAASDVLEQCDDLCVVLQTLGHQNLATTAVYLRRARIDAMREAMEGRSYREAVEAKR